MATSTPDAGFLSDYYTEDEFCEIIGKTRRTARQWRQQRIGPPWTKIGRDLILYPKQGFREHLKAEEIQPVRKRRTAA
jgi:hypothetical protein